MDVSDLWGLIDTARAEADDPSDAERVVDLAVGYLTRRTAGEVVATAQVLWNATAQSYRTDLWGAGPVAVALASTYRDGHVRKQTVPRMLEEPDLAWVPPLVPRTGDWVRPTPNRARTRLLLLVLANQPQTYLPVMLGMAFARARPAAGRLVYNTQALAVLLTAPPDLLSGCWPPPPRPSHGSSSTSAWPRMVGAASRDSPALPREV